MLVSSDVGKKEKKRETDDFKRQKKHTALLREHLLSHALFRMRTLPLRHLVWWLGIVGNLALVE